ncbi:hypothetical protein [Actinomyces provencensis]|uniref:hypothetical protein n=1 Tax=Actinomyces provencensis TaxID=1720198 RepID=UPI00096A6F1E|nr:hypothetical protein [Actinomyces provencensis]
MWSEETAANFEALEDHDLVYIVHLWVRPDPSTLPESPYEYALNLDTRILHDCRDVVEALDWARENSRGGPFQLFIAPVEHDGEDVWPTTLLPLWGSNPTVPEADGEPDPGPDPAQVVIMGQDSDPDAHST